MTYNEFLQNIINTRGQHGIPKKDYFEKHHIVPKCLGGASDNEKKKCFNKYSTHENCIWLYPQEHYIAHQLLARENQDNKALVYSFWCMSNRWLEARQQYVSCSAEDYAEARILLSNVMRGNQPEELNIRRSNTMLNKQLVWFTDGENEIRCSESQCPPGFFRGRCNSVRHSISIKAKARGTRLCGAANGMYGKKLSEETKKKIGQFGLGKHWYTNNITEVFTETCPKGFAPGRLKSVFDGRRKK